MLFYAKPILQHTFLMKGKINKLQTDLMLGDKAIRKYKRRERKKASTNWNNYKCYKKINKIKPTFKVASLFKHCYRLSYYCN